MKNAFKAALAMLLAVSLTACQQQSQTEPKTLKDAILMESDSKAMSFNEDYFVYVYKNNGEYTRVYGKISKELSEAINAVFLDDPDYKKTADLLATVKIEGSENLSANMPKEDDLKEYIGKPVRICSMKDLH